MNRDDFRQGVIDAFASLKNTDFATYKKYLDVNEDGTISEDEKQAAEGGNPIVQWAKDTYWKNAVKVKQGAMKTIPGTTGTTKPFNWNTPVSAQHNKNADWPVYKDKVVSTKYGNPVFGDYQNLGTLNQPPFEPILINEVVDYREGGKKVIKAEEITNKRTGEKKSIPFNDQVQFIPVAYSPSDDVLIVKVTADSAPNLIFSKDDVLALPAEKYDEILKRKPFGIFRNQPPSLLKRSNELRDEAVLLKSEFVSKSRK
jgi:hypothetical protein